MLLDVRYFESRRKMHTFINLRGQYRSYCAST